MPGLKVRKITSNDAFGNYPYILHIPAESRLRTSITKSSPKSTLRVGAINIAGFDSCEIQGVSFYRDGNVSLLDLEEKRIVEELVLNEDQYVTIRFVADGISFSIVLGQYGRMTWFGVISPILKSEMNGALKQLVRKIRKGKRSEYIQDRITWHLAPNIHVELSGKKTRFLKAKGGKIEGDGSKEEDLEEGLHWPVTIDVREEKLGIPSLRKPRAFSIACKPLMAGVVLLTSRGAFMENNWNTCSIPSQKLTRSAGKCHSQDPVLRCSLQISRNVALLFDVQRDRGLVISNRLGASGVFLLRLTETASVHRGSPPLLTKRTYNTEAGLRRTVQR